MWKKVKNFDSITAKNPTKPQEMRKWIGTSTSSTRERLSWSLLLIQVNISFLPTKYALSIIPILVAIETPWSNSLSHTRRHTEIERERGRENMEDKKKRGLVCINVMRNLWRGFKIFWLFLKKKKKTKTERIEWWRIKIITHKKKPKAKVKGHKRTGSLAPTITSHHDSYRTIF